MGRKINQGDVIKRFISVHGNRYDYSKVMYSKMHDKVTIVCSKHGEFSMSPHSHINGQGCPKCGIESRTEIRKDNIDTFINKSKEVHGEKYDYSRVEYIDSQTKVCVVCPEHGEFWIKPYSHIQGCGCRKCYNEYTRIRKSYNMESFVNKARQVHGDRYDYSKVEYIDSKTKVCIICPEHGEFWQSPNAHLRGHGCIKCGVDKTHIVMTTEEWVKKARSIHGDKYDYSKSVYKSPRSLVTIICPIHGEFRQKASYHLSGNGCQKCAVHDSKFEKEVYEFISTLENNVVRCDRSVLGNMEIDIFLPDKKIGIECDGLFWHSEVKRIPSYHIDKTKMCEDRGIKLIHVFEDEWIYKANIVKSRLKNILGLTPTRIYARNCTISAVSSNDAMLFLETNHIQGKIISKYNFGLYYNNELVSLMTFGNMRKSLGSNSSNGCFEMLRFCNKLDTNVIGGASRILKHFITIVNPLKIISYCDLRWSSGNMYDRLGFTLDHISQPNYFYIIGNKRKNRFNFRKNVLVEEGYDPSKTEHQIMLERRIYRIYDCGCKVYKMDF
jgi:hypothetical protein